MRILAQLGGRPASVAAKPVTQHIAMLQAASMTTGQIAEASGINVSTVRDHARGTLPTIHRTTAEKILAVQPHQQATIGFVPALASIRRLRALYAAGHTAHAIAATHPDLQIRSVDYIVRGARRFVSVANQAAIAHAYVQLADIQGASRRTQARAKAEGWVGPEYWDEDSFDDPHFIPATRDTPRYIRLAEDGLELEHLQGYTRQQAANRLGVSKDALQQAISRYRAAQTQAAA
ncbi:hypothetical protein EAO70_06120 [Streptomyces sp. adm13(2018)]|uniref:hypothetical protein n=1 Tax=Streptomyces sp. adm13(2018) TaxID=2479007 RepID=UPI0011CED188|nr:hypothetical protein [Streptomyces sp. adm13(2018)]TXS22433.1 hypothetical protein EAO70_06120 [Streptomyces sp. adm13(2018)]